MSTAVPMVRGPVEPLGVDVPGAADGEILARSPLQLFWARFRRDRVAVASLAFIVVLVLVAIAAPLIVSATGLPGPREQDTAAVDQDFGVATGPSSAHLLGVDGNGRDVLSRILYGARVSLTVALVATFLSMLAGVAAGMIAGYYRGWPDAVLSRIIDIVLAVPLLLLAVGIGSACSRHGCVGGTLKPGLSVVVLVIVVANWTYIARIIRGQVLSLREREFVEASRSLGASDRRILARDILPNLVAPIIVYGTLLIPQSILFEAALSFLSIGIQPPNPSWGGMIQDATTMLDSAWWYVAFPGFALLVTVLAFNLLGDGLQDALDPRRST